MEKEELLKLLDIKPISAGPSIAVKEVQTSQPEGSAPTLHPTALSMDEWDVGRGQELADKHHRIPLIDEEWADMHAAAYQLDPQTQPCEDPRRGEYVKTLLETPEFQATRSSTRLNPLASELAAVEAAKQWLALCKKDAQPPAKNSDPQALQARGQANCALAAALAAQAAGEAVGELEDTVAALGCGPGQGGNTQVPVEHIAQVYQRVRNDPRLRRIMELAGRYRRVAQGKQRSKVTHGYEDMVGVTLEDTVDRLLEEELALLVEEGDIGDDAARRLMEKECLGYDYRGVERVGKGPIVVCVDESGSMSGEPHYNAKAFALAMAWVARHQRRYCALVGYSGGREGTLCVLPPGKPNEGALMDWLVHFYGGGTTCDVPLRELPRDYWPRIGAPAGKTDVIVLTDAVVNVGRQMALDFNAWKVAHKVRCITLLIGNTGGAGGLAQVSDEVFNVNSITTEDGGVGRCLSI